MKYPSIWAPKVVRSEPDQFNRLLLPCSSVHVIHDKLSYCKTPSYLHVYTCLYYTALWLYRKVLSTVVLDEEMTALELEFHEQKTVLSIMNRYTLRLNISMASSEVKGSLSSFTAASVILSKLMRSGDIETNPGPGMSIHVLSWHVKQAPIQVEIQCTCRY